MPGARVQRVAGYVRQSKDDRGDAKSVERQEARIQEVARDRGWELVAVYTDLARSAARGKDRPELDRLLSRLDDVDAIAFTKLDRLARSVSHLLKVVERCQDAGVQVIATDDDIDTTRASGRAMMQMRGVFAELELETTRERYQNMVDGKRANGEWIGKAPYGWRVRANHLVPEPAEQRVLRRAARSYIKGATFSDLAREHGFKAPAIIRSILRSPRVRDELGDLGLDLHAAIRAREMKRARQSGPSLLGGVARCSLCGQGLRRSSTHAGRRGRWGQYRCRQVGHVGIAASWLDDHVSRAVLDAIDLKELTKRTRERQRHPASAEVLVIRARIEELEDAFGDGTLTKAAFTRQRDRQEAKLAEAETAVAEEVVSAVPLDLARHLPQRWEGMTTEGRRDVIRALIREVRVTKATGNGPIDEARVTIHWRT